ERSRCGCGKERLEAHVEGELQSAWTIRRAWIAEGIERRVQEVRTDFTLGHVPEAQGLPVGANKGAVRSHATRAVEEGGGGQDGKPVGIRRIRSHGRTQRR